MPSVEKITQNIIDVIRKKAQESEKQKDARIELEKINLLEKEEAIDPEIYSLIDKLYYPSCKIKGPIGKIADFFLSKMFYATRIYLKPLINHQENINNILTNNVNQLKANEKWIASIKRELFAEIKYKFDILSVKTNNISKEIFSLKIINHNKLRKLNPKKINLGCGLICYPDYINIDMRELDGVDIVAKVDNLPFDKNSIDEIYNAHLIEHFSQYQFEKNILPYWYNLLKTGGTLKIIFPDIENMMKQYFDKKINWHTLREVTYGSQDYEGNYHYNMFTFDSLRFLLEKAGFKEVKLIDQARKNDQCLEAEIIAIK